MANSAVTWITGNADIINNIAANMLPVQRLISATAYIMGLGFAYKAIMTLKEHGESRSSMNRGQSSMKEPMMYLLVAAIFIYFPTGLAVILNTTFGSSQGGNILSYEPVNSDSFLGGLFGNNSPVGRSLALIIQTLGGIAFVRGWVLIARASGSGQQPGGTGKGLIHIFGGVLAMNIVLTLQIINNTLYGVR